MKFRISMKNDSKHDSAKPVQVSIPQKDAIAIEPPKKVIKALFDFTADPDTPMYLSFSAGDFLHVVSRENDKDWYEACNPLRGERGLVPVKYFETVGKTVRDSGDSSKSMAGATHDSGYAEGAPPATHVPPVPRTNITNGAFAHRPTKSLGGSGVYGIVMYDFHPERPDELEAFEGEAIIVIAQSNPEWFVAKPITRLGGPGLIPVSFIEVRDMTTGKAAEDPVAAVAKAGIPTVEEWKKMAADYKNTSIPLGTVSSSQQAQSLQQSMDRMSLNSNQQNGYGHARQTSNAVVSQQQQQQQQQQRNLFAVVRASVPRCMFGDDKYHFIVECRLSNGAHWNLSRIYEDFYQLQINLKKAFPEEAGDVPGKPRVLPFMPGPVQFVTDGISEGRRESLDGYLRDLLRLPQHISSSLLVRQFFAPRTGDYEVDPNGIDLNEHARPAEQDPRYSQTSQVSHNNAPYYQPHQVRQPPYQQPHGSTPPQGHSRAQPSQASANFPPHLNPNDRISPVSRQNTNTTLASITSGGAVTPISGPGAQYPVKLKAWFDRDTCVVIRMPPHGQFTFAELYRKIIERRQLEFRNSPSKAAAAAQDGAGEQDPSAIDPDAPLDIEYRDEADGEYYRLEDDDDMNGALQNALRRAEERSALGQERAIKLTLAVRPLHQGKE